MQSTTREYRERHGGCVTSSGSLRSRPSSRVRRWPKYLALATEVAADSTQPDRLVGAPCQQVLGARRIAFGQKGVSRCNRALADLKPDLPALHPGETGM